MYFIDTHSHIFLPEFDEDRADVVERAFQNNINKILLPNVDAKTISQLIEVTEKYPNQCFPMMGLHPTSVDENFQVQLDIIEDWLRKYKFIAVGEIGIDMYWDKTFLNEQQEAFKYQIKLAQKLKLPIVIHTREAFNEVFEIMDELYDENLHGIFHSFTGSYLDAQKIIEYGFKIGVGGIVTFKNAGLDKIIENIDLNHIVLETDSPYLAPVPFRGKRNESSYITYIAQKVADLHKVSLEEVAHITSRNAMEVFKI
jgi:TatD DNase family protein